MTYLRMLAVPVAVVASVLLAVPVAAAPLDATAEAPIRAALSALDRGDAHAFAFAFTADATIVDEISPFRFTGTNAAATWFERLGAVNRENAIGEERTVAFPARSGSVEGDTAYAIVPVRIGYRQRGRPLTENGVWTFALKKVAGAWKIAAAAFAAGASH